MGTGGRYGFWEPLSDEGGGFAAGEAGRRESFEKSPCQFTQKKNGSFLKKWKLLFLDWIRHCPESASAAGQHSCTAYRFESDMSHRRGVGMVSAAET